MLREITHRRVLAIALPIVLSNATVPILGAVDTGVVGQLGEAAPIGAVGIGAIILTAIYWIFGFLRMGTAGLVAQARGGGEVAETGALLTRALMIAGAAGLTFIILQGPIFAGAFMLAPASDEVERLAQNYMAIRIWSSPAIISVYALTGWLVAMERTRGVLAIQLTMNGLNIVLDLWFVLGLGWGVEGVAIATLIAEWSGALLGIWLCRAAFTGGQWHQWARVFDPARLKRMAAVNTDIMIRSVLLQVAFVSFLFYASHLGDVTLAANQILLQFLHIIAYGMDGFAFAAEALVGSALGARNRVLLRRGALLTSVWGGIVALVMTLGFLFFGGTIIDFMTTAPEVREEAREFLGWLVIAPIAGVASWMLDGIFIGATRTRDMRNCMIISVIMYGVTVVLFVNWFGNAGLWAALMMFNFYRAVTLASRYPALERAAERIE
ncbi:MATE family efflux transporter [Algicella marina]|uniref:MATE family efflux transporter n=1 Tax=Algicella marina TaxID=2683284 RepID=A0A6P1T7T3_9RHOB|nr:MATE family efflux transporter [Algicella marina]